MDTKAAKIIQGKEKESVEKAKWNTEEAEATKWQRKVKPVCGGIGEGLHIFPGQKLLKTTIKTFPFIFKE